VDVGLVGLGFLSGEAAEAGEKARRDADSDQLLRITGDGAADAASSTELFISGFWNVGEVQLAIRNILDAPCALLAAR